MLGQSDIWSIDIILAAFSSDISDVGVCYAIVIQKPEIILLSVHGVWLVGWLTSRCPAPSQRLLLA